jgi:hypothetical protein
MIAKISSRSVNVYFYMYISIYSRISNMKCETYTKRKREDQAFTKILIDSLASW